MQNFVAVDHFNQHSLVGQAVLPLVQGLNQPLTHLFLSLIWWS